ncbi:hypothetical protein Tco_0897763 [Tanacetum coccineum]
MEDGIFFNQSKYIKEMLKKFGLEESKLMKTPMFSDTKLTKDEEFESVDSTKYRGMIELVSEPGYREPDSVMSSSSTVTYTSVYADSELRRVFLGTDEELPDGGPEYPPSPVEAMWQTPIRMRIEVRHLRRYRSCSFYLLPIDGLVFMSLMMMTDDDDVSDDEDNFVLSRDTEAFEMMVLLLTTRSTQTNVPFLSRTRLSRHGRLSDVTPQIVGRIGNIGSGQCYFIDQ